MGEQVRIEQEVVVDAPQERTFRGFVDGIGDWFVPGEGMTLNMKIEPRVGGRMFRDLGDGAGHLWGFVQVIKPPALLEIAGPMWISQAATTHLQVRFIEEGDRTRVRIVHTAIGVAPYELGDASEGWKQGLKELKDYVERH